MIIVFLTSLYCIDLIFEAFEYIAAELAPFLNSEAGTLITAAAAAYLTFRWYRNRHSVERG